MLERPLSEFPSGASDLRKAILGILFSAIFLSGFVLPAHAATVPNSIEGNWTSYIQQYSITNSNLQNPIEVAVDTNGIAYFDEGNGGLYTVSVAGVVKSLAGHGFGGAVGIVGSAHDFSGLGTYLVSLDDSGAVAVVDVSEAGVIAIKITLPATFGSYGAIAISPDGQWVIVADSALPPHIVLEKGAGTAAGTACLADGSNCPPDNDGGQSCGGPACAPPIVTTSVTSVFIGPGTTGANTTSGGINGIVANFTLPVIIIIIVIATAIILRVTRDEKGPRAPRPAPSVFRPPGR